jgi:hypothetical protein
MESRVAHFRWSAAGQPDRKFRRIRETAWSTLIASRDVACSRFIDLAWGSVGGARDRFVFGLKSAKEEAAGIGAHLSRRLDQRSDRGE